MIRRYETIYSPALGRQMSVLAFGHYGAPVIAFPSGGGTFYDFENNGMVEELRPLIERGKIKLYCPDGIDNDSWLANGVDLYWREINHNKYQDFIISNLVEAIRFDCQSSDIKIGLTGCSIGAYHAVNFTLKYPHLFDYALGLSGRYDLESILGFSTASTEVYFNNPMAYLSNIHGEQLGRLQREIMVVLVCGQGAWEDKCLHDTGRLTDLMGTKGIPNYQDVWGYDVEHHWYWWRKQISHHFGVRYGG